MSAIENLRNLGTKADRQFKRKLPTIVLAGILAFTGVSCAPESRDRIAPVITILGENPATVEQGTIYVDPGARARDNVDGDLTAQIIVIDTPVETKTTGTKKIIYIVYDRAGNPNRPPAERVINVIPPFH